MKSDNALLRTNRWPLPRVLMLVFACAFSGLMIDIRVEHVDVVRERSVAWLPIVYAGFMMLACLAASAFWRRRTRLFMYPLFAAAVVIGGLGFYFHNHGNIKGAFGTSVAAWTDPHLDRPDTPPQLAPLAFAGLGAVGVLALLERFNA